MIDPTATDRIKLFEARAAAMLREAGDAKSLGAQAVFLFMAQSYGQLAQRTQSRNV